jgi:hypothetical protein
MKPLRSAARETGEHVRGSKRASALLGGFRVECKKKTTGAWILFSRYPTRDEAQKVSNCLAGLGEAVRIVAPT